MVIKHKKVAKKAEKSAKSKKKIVEETDKHAGGASLDDAFADSEDVDYGKPNPRKSKKLGAIKAVSEKEMEDEVEEIEEKFEAPDQHGDYEIKASKPITALKKGDKVRVDNIEYEIDAHYVLIDHGGTREMALEIFNAKTDKDYQLRYFSDQVESTLDFYELQEILYVKRPFKRIEW